MLFKKAKNNGYNTYIIIKVVYLILPVVKLNKFKVY